MRSVLRKQVDILTNSLTMVNLSTFEIEGDQVHFRRLVSLSPAMQQGPLLSFCNTVAIFKKRASRTLCVDETIEESNYVQGQEALVFSYAQQKHSDTILNSTLSYPIKSNITIHKNKGDIICHM